MKAPPQLQTRELGVTSAFYLSNSQALAQHWPFLGGRWKQASACGDTGCLATIFSGVWIFAHSLPSAVLKHILTRKMFIRQTNNTSASKG